MFGGLCAGVSVWLPHGPAGISVKHGRRSVVVSFVVAGSAVLVVLLLR